MPSDDEHEGLLAMRSPKSTKTSSITLAVEGVAPQSRSISSPVGVVSRSGCTTPEASDQRRFSTGRLSACWWKGGASAIRPSPVISANGDSVMGAHSPDDHTCERKAHVSSHPSGRRGMHRDPESRAAAARTRKRLDGVRRAASAARPAQPLLCTLPSRLPKPLATVSACRPEKAGAGRAVRSPGVPVLACACGGREAAT